MERGWGGSILRSEGWRQHPPHCDRNSTPSRTTRLGNASAPRASGGSACRTWCTTLHVTRTIFHASESLRCACFELRNRANGAECTESDRQPAGRQERPAVCSPGPPGPRSYCDRNSTPSRTTHRMHQSKAATPNAPIFGGAAANGGSARLTWLAALLQTAAAAPAPHYWVHAPRGRRLYACMDMYT